MKCLTFLSIYSWRYRGVLKLSVPPYWIMYVGGEFTTQFYK